MKLLNNTSPLHRGKQQRLLQNWQYHTVQVQESLTDQGITRQLVNKYVLSGWLERIGYGAYIRRGDAVNWLGGLHAIQYQLEHNCHIAGKTALEHLGLAHYIPMNQGSRKYLIQHQSDRRLLPKWFSDYFSNDNIVLTRASLFGDNLKTLGIIEYENDNFQVKISCPERAILEYLYLLNDEETLEEAIQLLEGLTSLRYQLLQSLLEECTSIRVKRLFLALSDHSGHAWFKRLELEKITLGSGKRVCHQGGRYFPKYKISIPI